MGVDMPIKERVRIALMFAAAVVFLVVGVLLLNVTGVALMHGGTDSIEGEFLVLFVPILGLSLILLAYRIWIRIRRLKKTFEDAYLESLRG
jgi:hypothetical protein